MFCGGSSSEARGVISEMLGASVRVGEISEDAGVKVGEAYGNYDSQKTTSLLVKIFQCLDSECANPSVH